MIWGVRENHKSDRLIGTVSQFSRRRFIWRAFTPASEEKWWGQAVQIVATGRTNSVEQGALAARLAYRAYLHGLRTKDQANA